jgi:hypothetical protein
MATLGDRLPTIVDVAKRTDPNGKIARIAELLAQKNEHMQDAEWKEGNLPVGHLVTVRTGLPTPTWRMLNGAVRPTKSRTAQIQEQCGMLEDYSVVDVDVAKLNGNVGDFRMSEGKPHVEGISQEFSSTFWYGAASSPEEFVGLAARYGVLSGAEISENVIGAGGTGSDNASIYIVGWGEEGIYCIYPKGAQAGIQHEDYGVQLVQQAVSGEAIGMSSGLIRAYREWWQLKAGICVRDWRYGVRICNIDISNLTSKTTPADLTELLFNAVTRIPDRSSVKLRIYMNRTVYRMLGIQRRDDVIEGGGLRFENVDGVMRPTFDGIPIRLADSLLNSEATVA